MLTVEALVETTVKRRVVVVTVPGTATSKAEPSLGSVPTFKVVPSENLSVAAVTWSCSPSLMRHDRRLHNATLLTSVFGLSKRTTCEMTTG
jgi:hypothetical protein